MKTTALHNRLDKIEDDSTEFQVACTAPLVERANESAYAPPGEEPSVEAKAENRYDCGPVPLVDGEPDPSAVWIPEEGEWTTRDELAESDRPVATVLYGRYGVQIFD